MLKVSRIFIVTILLSVLVCAQKIESSIGWDLSYKLLLERNNVTESDWIWQWLKKYRSPAETWVANWKGEPIVSSILIEFPAFHAAEHTTMWFVRTKDEAHYWELVEGREADKNEELIKPEIYDALFNEVSSWRQLHPKPASKLPKEAPPGYFGLLSVFDSSGSRQMLLTLEDFVICLDESCEPGKLKSGRLMESLKPILLPEETYQHKSEAEIARMTPSERIDELIKEGSHVLDISDDHSLVIRKYLRADGLRGLPYLIRLIDGYDPKHVRDTRFFDAMMIADDIDGFVLRLRASPEGRRVIEAIELLSARIRAAGKTDSMVEMVLRFTKGVNMADESIRDTLWVKYRIKISDSELLELSNYLVEHDPTYPSWSGRVFIKDDSRINEAGNPAQVFIMEEPKRYFEVYLSFKKSVKSSN